MNSILRKRIFSVYYIYIYKGKWETVYPGWKTGEKLDLINEHTYEEQFSNQNNIKNDFIKVFKSLPWLIKLCFITMFSSIAIMLIGSYNEKPILAGIAIVVYLLMFLTIWFCSNQINERRSLSLFKEYMDKNIAPFKSLLKQYDLFSESKLEWIIAPAKKNETTKKIGGIFSLVLPIILPYLIDKLSHDIVTLAALILLVIFALAITCVLTISEKATAQRNYIEDLEYLLADIRDSSHSQIKSVAKVSSEGVENAKNN